MADTFGKPGAPPRSKSSSYPSCWRLSRRSGRCQAQRTLSSVCRTCPACGGQQLATTATRCHTERRRLRRGLPDRDRWRRSGRTKASARDVPAGVSATRRPPGASRRLRGFNDRGHVSPSSRRTRDRRTNATRAVHLGDDAGVLGRLARREVRDHAPIASGARETYRPRHGARSQGTGSQTGRSGVAVALMAHLPFTGPGPPGAGRCPHSRARAAWSR
jgi:hypothetical protein